MSNETKTVLSRRNVLLKLGLGAAAIYAAPVMLKLGEARASGASGGSGGSGSGGWGGGSGSGSGSGRWGGGRGGSFSGGRRNTGSSRNRGERAVRSIQRSARRAFSFS